MSNRYWINDGGNWNDSSHWSETSGGVSGATVPASGDSVYFNDLSFTGTSIITINATANCCDFIWTGITQSVTLTNSAYNLNVYGSLCLWSGLTANFTSTGYLYLKSTLTGNTITTNGVSTSLNRLHFDGIGGEWVNQDDCDFSNSDIYHVDGHWNTNSNTISTTGGYYVRSGQPGGKTMTLGGSYFYVKNFDGGNGIIWGQWYVNAGTSNIICSSNFIPVTTRRTFYNVTCAYTNGGYFVHIFNNLTIISGAYANTLQLYNVGMIVNDTLTIKGYNSTNYRTLIFNYVFGTQITLSASTVIFENVDFRDVNALGTANWNLSGITGGSGDAGGNSGITFTSGQTQYYYHTGSTTTLWSDSTKWFIDSGHTLFGRVPLPQDDVIFDENSFSTGCTLTVDCSAIGRSLDMSEVAYPVTMSLANAVGQYGSHVLGNNITPSGNYSRYLYGRNNSFYYNTFGKTTWSFQLYAPGATYINLSHIFVTGTAGLSFNYGTFDMNDYNFTFTTDGVTINAGATLYMGSGIFWAGRAIGYALTIIGTIYAENSTLKMGGTWGSNDITYNLGGKTFNNILIDNLSTGHINISGSNNINKLKINKGNRVEFDASSQQNINHLQSIGTSSSGITIGSTTTGTTFTLSGITNNWDAEYITISDSIVIPTQKAGLYSTDGGNTTGWTFGETNLRYWIGDTGNWDDTGHWSYESSGSTGAIIPTSGNSVYFDENSFSTGSTITINATASCYDMNWSGMTQSVTLTNSAYNLNVYGGFILSDKLSTAFSSTGYLYLRATTTVDIITNGNTASWNRFYFIGTGGIYNLRDNWTSGIGNIGPSTLNTNNYNINWSRFWVQGDGIANLGSSNITTAGYSCTGTLNAGTSTMTITSNAGFEGGGKTYYNVIYNNTTGGSPSGAITGNNTFNNLTLIGPSSVLNDYYFSANQIVNGDLVLSGVNSSNYRLLIYSYTLGNQYKITTNSVLAYNVDFRDIYLSGSSIFDLSSITGGSGDCGGNSGITFTSGQTQYFYTTGSTVSWSSVSNWFLNSSGITQGRVPLPQDDAIFDENSFNQATTTLTIDCARIGKSLNMSSVSKSVSITFSNSTETYGDYILGSNISTPFANNSRTLMGRDNYTIKTFNTVPYYFNINGYGGSYTLQSDFLGGSINGGSILFNLYSGSTLYLNDYNLETGRLNIAGNLYCGGGEIKIKQYNAFAGFTSTGTIYSENSTIKFVPDSPTSNSPKFEGGNKTYNKLWLSGSHTGYYDITGSNTFNEILIDPGRKARFESGKTQTSKYFNAIGISGNTISIGSTATGSTHSLIRTDNWYLDYCVIQDSVVSPDTNAGYSSIDNGNNSGWTFNISNLKYWIGESGDWGDSSHWSYSIGGASGATLPTPSDKVFFNEYSFSSPSSIDINVDADCYDMLWTGVTQSVTISNTGHTLNIYKDMTLYSGVTWNFSGIGYLYLKSVIDSYIITNGSILNVNRLYFDGDNNWVNLDDLNLGSSDIYHESGNWLTSGKTITTTGKYYTTGSTLKYLDLSTSTLNLGSYIDEYGVQLSAGTSQINISEFNSIFKGYDNTFYNVKFINGAYIYDNNIFNNLEISNDNNIDYKLQLYGNQNINGILTLSGTNSTNYRLLVTSNEFNVQRSLFASDVLAYNVDFRDIVSDGSFDWDLSAIIGGSGDWGGNSGITFTTAQDQYLYSSGDTINWGDESVWFLGSGGSGGNGRMPLAQDNVIIDESFTSALEGHINFDIGDKIYCNDFDCYDINKFLFVSDNGDIPINIKGNLYLSPMFEFEQRTNIIKLVCRDSSTASLENSLLGIVSFLYGDYTIYGNTECESFQVYSDAKVTIYSQEIEITGEYSPALYIGGNNSYDTTSWCDGTTFKIDETGSSNIQIQPFSNDANCNIWLTGSITGDYEIKSDIPATTYYINYLLVDPGKSIKTSSGLTINFNNFSAVGTVESGITIGTIESGYTSTFNYTGPIVNKPVIYGQYLSISDSVATPSSIWYAGPTSTDLGNNSGWIFSLRGRLILYDSKLVLNKPTSSHPLLFTNHFLL